MISTSYSSAILKLLSAWQFLNQMPDIVNSILLDAGYFCFYINISELCSGLQLLLGIKRLIPSDLSYKLCEVLLSAFILGPFSHY